MAKTLEQLVAENVISHHANGQPEYARLLASQVPIEFSKWFMAELNNATSMKQLNRLLEAVVLYSARSITTSLEVMDEALPVLDVDATIEKQVIPLVISVLKEKQVYEDD